VPPVSLSAKQLVVVVLLKYRSGPVDGRFVSLHAFVDESRRNNTYLLAAVHVDPGDLPRLRKLMQSLLFPGQRELHFKKETPARRRMIFSRMADAGTSVWIYRRSCDAGDEAARQDCLRRLTDDLLDLRATRLVLDTREDRDIHDVRTIRSALGKKPRKSQLSYEHMVSTQERLLWRADAAAWAHGAGGDWSRRARQIVTNVLDLDYL
jgi:hypothetical protein